ncbi:phosphoribosylaminoimidazole-succinocarboxamide synthase [Flavobacteriales bacterium ALC-1]|nr:phosphoribosylaminoimidazole-succinocarboxamide synthase [Flavobacteriales bacterium ALC-1]
MKHLSILLGSLIIFSCNSKTKDTFSYTAKTTEALVETDHVGKKLMETNCYVCHSPTASHDVRLAPPMEAIKRHYINDNTSKEAFIKSMQNWIKNPTEANAKMYGAVKRFGLMPKQDFSEETIRSIADYMYENDIDKPEWFDKHHKKNRN